MGLPYFVVTIDKDIKSSIVAGRSSCRGNNFIKRHCAVTLIENRNQTSKSTTLGTRARK